MYSNRLTRTLADFGVLIPETDDVYKHMNHEYNTDWYMSCYKYTQEQKDEFNKHGSVSGVTDVVTDKLWWDFDSDVEPSLAQKDALVLCKRLQEKGINDFNISFSGNKGFCVEVYINKNINPGTVKKICLSLAEGLPTIDKKMYNAQRILRVCGTKHPKTGYYKMPITLKKLETKNLDEIISFSKNILSVDANLLVTKVVSLPESLSSMKETKEVSKGVSDKKFNINNLDFTHKVKGWSNCKWALANGYQVKANDRHEKMLCIVAQCKTLHYTKEQAYQTAKEADRIGCDTYGVPRIDKVELWDNIVGSVYSDSWKGGTYTCKDCKTDWLKEICDSLGPNKCKHEEDKFKIETFADLKDDFKKYVKNIDKNTIYTGLPSIDQHVFLSTGANVVIVGSAGSGKTSIGLEILENTSRANVRSVVASLDMARNRIFEKVLYRLTGLPRNELYNKFQKDEEADIMNTLKESYGNVNFFKRTSPSVTDIKNYVLQCNENTEDKVKLVVVDYFERITSEFSDDTASSKKVSGELQDLVDELDVCLITLYQPNKHAISSGPDNPIYDYTKIKGSSFVYQAPRIILSAWRPFYNPKDFSKDKFMQMAVLKNDLGELAEFAFNWNGKRGKISEMNDNDWEDFQNLLKAKEESKKPDTDKMPWQQ